MGYKQIGIPAKTISTTQLSTAAVIAEKTDFIKEVKNIFDHTDAKVANNRVLVATGGTEGTTYSENRMTTGYMPVKAGDNLICSYLSTTGALSTVSYYIAAAYDKNLKRVDFVEATSSTYVVPSGAEYVRLSFNTSYYARKAYVQVAVGTAISLPTKYKKRMGVSLLDKPYKPVKDTIAELVQNSLLLTGTSTVNIKLVGDSITHGVGGTGFLENGDLIISGFNRNPNGYCWAKLFKEYMEAKFNCVVTNNACRGTHSGYLRQYWNTLISATDDIVICMYGTNDRGSGTYSALLDNLQLFLNRVDIDNQKIILMSSIQASVTNDTAYTFHMEDVDNAIMSIAAANNVEYISLFKLFRDYIDARNISFDTLSADGLHPNDAGYDIMFYLILNALGLGNKVSGATW